MANKFTKSVLERQAKERRQHPDGQAEGERRRQPPPRRRLCARRAQRRIRRLRICTAARQPRRNTRSHPRADSGSREPQPLPAQPKARSKSAKAAPAVDLTAFIVRDEGRSAKNKTFYLDAAVIDALHRAAVAQKVTDSKLVKDILKKLLGV